MRVIKAENALRRVDAVTPHVSPLFNGYRHVKATCSCYCWSNCSTEVENDVAGRDYYAQTKKEQEDRENAEARERFLEQQARLSVNRPLKS